MAKEIRDRLSNPDYWFYLSLFYLSTINSAYILQLVLWSELYNSIKSGTGQLNVKRSRKIAFSLSAIVISLVFLLAIFTVSPVPLSLITTIYLAILSFENLVIAVGFLFFCFKTVRQMGLLTDLRPSSQRKSTRFRRVTWTLVWSSILCIIYFFYYLGLLATGASSSPESWLKWSYPGRFIELVMVLGILANYGLNLWNVRPGRNMTSEESSPRKNQSSQLKTSAEQNKESNELSEDRSDTTAATLSHEGEEST